MDDADLAEKMQCYRCHKEVRAAKIIGIVRDVSGVPKYAMVELPNRDVGRFQPTSMEMLVRAVIGDYAVLYRDNYKSISPAKEFEDGYAAI